jgi:hypothetical protein
MGNVLIVARREFADLLSNRLVVAILIVYVFIAVIGLCSRVFLSDNALFNNEET